MKNKRNKVASLLKFGIFSLSLLFWNCDQDQIIPQKKSFNVEKININEFNKNSKLKSILTKFNNKQYLNKRSQVINEANNFTLLTDNILKVRTETTIVYTFKIETPTVLSSEFENFVIVQTNNNTFNYYIYRYQLDIQNSNIEFPYIINKQKIENINIDNLQNYLGKESLQAMTCYVVEGIVSPRDFSVTYVLVEVSCGGSTGGVASVDTPPTNYSSTNTTNGSETTNNTDSSSYGGSSSSSGSPTGIISPELTALKIKYRIKTCLPIIEQAS